ncbi:hypothetical protein Trydic_g5653 [Trypoxylus dichotomus]
MSTCDDVEVRMSFGCLPISGRGSGPWVQNKHQFAICFCSPSDRGRVRHAATLQSHSLLYSMCVKLCLVLGGKQNGAFVWCDCLLGTTSYVASRMSQIPNTSRGARFSDNDIEKTVLHL